jgi:hypothetical protein
MNIYVFGPGGEDSATQTITINPLPQPIIINTGSDILSAGSGYSVYIWSNGIPPVIITGATSSTYTITTSGIYGVAVDSGGCWGYDTISAIATGIKSVNTKENKFWLTSSSNNSITLHTSLQLNEELTVNIFDAAGKQILDDQWPAGTDTKQINDISVPPGSYIIKLNNRGTSEALKWTKQ